jgi:hypothetical protein
MSLSALIALRGACGLVNRKATGGNQNSADPD